MAEIYYEPTGCNCDGTDYTRDDINAAATKALSLASQGQTIGRDKYPHAYNDYEHFTFAHASAPYLEFPILQSGNIYDGSAPGPDRVVIGSISEDFSSAVYCAVITHDGQRKNGFAECSDDTMNVRGKGTFVGKGKGEEGVGGRFGRKLVKRIDL
ncbi:MAG: hypothetical protein M1830_007841 [Pleopsidium flavum]|nr:MAG: hypothetical protein M1830_007841 [Pleopsidium flavum]